MNTEPDSDSQSKSNPGSDTHPAAAHPPEAGTPRHLADGKAELMARAAFRPSADWTQHLHPATPPPPAAVPAPPAAGETSATSTSVTVVCDSPATPKAETSTVSTISTGGGEKPAPAGMETSTISTVSTGGGEKTREHPIPEDSILMDYRDFARCVSELPDGLIVAPILALCGKLLTPNVTLNFGSQKPLTIYNFVACPAGLRKGTTFAPAIKIARHILTPEDLIGGNASDSALFDTFEQQPHRLQFEDEGNTILRSWESQSYGRETSARYLGLYDGSPWHQNFLREGKSHGDGESQRHIEQATLSLCMGSTFGVARLDQIASGCGLRRRFGFYVATRQARQIWWPESLEGEDLQNLTDLFRNLTTLKGSVGRDQLTKAAKHYWVGLQQRNRDRCESIPGYTNGDESLLSSLNESPARCLKLAIIFQACRWARGSITDPFTITPEILELAEAHQNGCLDALIQLEGMSRRVQVDDTAEWLLAQITGDHSVRPGQKQAAYTKSQLTHRFAANPGRLGALTASKLYGDIIPHLVSRQQCVVSKSGNLYTYTFTWE
ncbi:DUF3987 domain-containing protein [Prosthecobacter sp.]|uniref:DUF3987 domain-containing protein n=1 Tax=Prosthecobacter sp. TaxID=1965333 RepID=UPI002487FC3A|nr:DUF3987 domain-containing protein [Prosthecobacter sp.]MDI1312107.1 DUF3987 domain-containing protein [Prosthecobacter sp.]